ncbi:MAG TPA: hypothetical protein VJ957_03370, partial [Longimicrobiales bacterium]|nr:hypothetical protein [Longimicrobiales bacterium]
LWPPAAVARYRDALIGPGLGARSFVVLSGDAVPAGLLPGLRAGITALRHAGESAMVARALVAANALSAHWRRVKPRRAGTDRTTTPPPGHRA